MESVLHILEEYIMDVEIEMLIGTSFTILFIIGMLSWAYIKLKALSVSGPKSDTFEDNN